MALIFAAIKLMDKYNEKKDFNSGSGTPNADMVDARRLQSPDSAWLHSTDPYHPPKLGYPGNHHSDPSNGREPSNPGQATFAAANHNPPPYDVPASNPNAPVVATDRYPNQNTGAFGGPRHDSEHTRQHGHGLGIAAGQEGRGQAFQHAEGRRGGLSRLRRNLGL